MVKKVLISILLSVPCTLAMDCDSSDGTPTEHGNDHGSNGLEKNHKKRGSRRLLDDASDEEDPTGGSTRAGMNGKPHLKENDRQKQKEEQETSDSLDIPPHLKRVNSLFYPFEIWFGTAALCVLSYILYKDALEILAERAKLAHIEKAKQAQAATF